MYMVIRLTRKQYMQWRMGAYGFEPSVWWVLTSWWAVEYEYGVRSTLSVYAQNNKNAKVYFVSFRLVSLSDWVI